MAGDESGRRLEQRLRLVAVHRVAASVELQQLRLRYPGRDAVDLRHRSVFVVVSLHREHRAADRGQRGFDVPAAKRGIEPDVVPAPEGGVDVGVMARQALAQVGGAVEVARAITPATLRGKAPACSSAIDAPSLWPKSQGGARSTSTRNAASSAGSASCAWMCMKSGRHRRACGRGVEPP
jgi:hypothetical protein